MFKCFESDIFVDCSETNSIQSDIFFVSVVFIPQYSESSIAEVWTRVSRAKSKLSNKFKNILGMFIYVFFSTNKLPFPPDENKSRIFGVTIPSLVTNQAGILLIFLRINFCLFYPLKVVFKWFSKNWMLG